MKRLGRRDSDRRDSDRVRPCPGRKPHTDAAARRVAGIPRVVVEEEGGGEGGSTHRAACASPRGGPRPETRGWALAAAHPSAAHCRRVCAACHRPHWPPALARPRSAAVTRRSVPHRNFDTPPEAPLGRGQGGQLPSPPLVPVAFRVGRRVPSPPQNQPTHPPTHPRTYPPPNTTSSATPSCRPGRAGGARCRRARDAGCAAWRTGRRGLAAALVAGPGGPAPPGGLGQAPHRVPEAPAPAAGYGRPPGARAGAPSARPVPRVAATVIIVTAGVRAQVITNPAAYQPQRLDPVGPSPPRSAGPSSRSQGRPGRRRSNPGSRAARRPWRGRRARPERAPAASPPRRRRRASPR